MNREDRLREALRANLQRRKMKARGLRERVQAQTERPTEKAGETGMSSDGDAVPKPVDDQS
ncbi:MAG: hypothetical protein AAGI12_11265 [Pseudomonadota bacterium]